jgi:hypothetical protein
MFNVFFFLVTIGLFVSVLVEVGESVAAVSAR